jgi:putative DNA primase/helicase
VPDAAAPIWEGFLQSIFVKPAVIAFVRRLLGYCLTGDVREHILPIFWGAGANGKSTLLNAFMQTVGPDFAMKAPHDLLMTKKNESHPTERADLFGKRFVACIETGDGRGLNETLVKELTGGDKIKARRLYEDFWEFDPTHKPVICTNHKPRVRGTDNAIWRRLALVPFEVQFWNPDRGDTGPEELRQDKGLADKLKAEAEGILAWAVAGCLEWQHGGLQLPDEVLIATAEYRSSQDAVAEFIADRCVVSPLCKQRASALYEAYRDWSAKAGEPAFSQKKFGEALTERGFQRQSNNGVWYSGIGLANDFTEGTE